MIKFKTVGDAVEKRRGTIFEECDHLRANGTQHKDAAPLCIAQLIGTGLKERRKWRQRLAVEVLDLVDNNDRTAVTKSFDNMSAISAKDRIESKLSSSK